MTAGHAFVRPGQVAPDLPAPDNCMRCGLPEAGHHGAADPRVGAARAFLAEAKQRKFADKPNSVLVREAAELRHQLGQVLKVIDAGAVLTPADILTVRDALDVAADCKRDRAANCPDCEPAEACETCTWRLRLAAGYDALAGRLGGDS